MVEWIEVRGPTVDVAVDVAMKELGVGARADVEVEVLEQPDKGFLGIGRKDAVVKVKLKHAEEPQRKSRRGRGGRGKGRDRAGTGAGRDASSGGRDSGAGNSRSKGNGGGPRAGKEDRGSGGKAGEKVGSGGGQRQRQGGGSRGGAAQSRGRSDGPGGNGGRSKATSKGDDAKGGSVSERTQEVDREEQAKVVSEFLEGLLDAFGLEGEVRTEIDDDVILAFMDGEQTEALIGDKASIMYAIHELVRTVVQRKTMASARVRLDIGGYAERRREALKVYAGRLAEQVLEDGDEIMLEPMSAADRKVVHDSIAEIDGVRSFSEGEDPRRSVVIAPD